MIMTKMSKVMKAYFFKYKNRWNQPIEFHSKNQSGKLTLNPISKPLLL